MSYESNEDRIEKLEKQFQELSSIVKRMIESMKVANTESLSHLELYLHQHQFSLTHHKVISQLVAGHRNEELLKKILADTARTETQMDFIHAQIASELAKQRATQSDDPPNPDGP